MKHGQKRLNVHLRNFLQIQEEYEKQEGRIKYRTKTTAQMDKYKGKIKWKKWGCATLQLLFWVKFFAGIGVCTHNLQMS